MHARDAARQHDEGVLPLDSFTPPRERLAAVLAPDLLDALDQLITERIEGELARLGAAAENGPRWLTLEEAGKRLDCSPAAVRMRARRGRLVTRRHGRRVYVAAESVDKLA
jgi:hypothetical protein